mmetsp:Transcript_25514/g.87606  ORF Transcript_25514/g.87606 Transcript_25514/m.87606 type:complete len:203 (+) Transcript_25514:478-1086(+)
MVLPSFERRRDACHGQQIRRFLSGPRPLRGAHAQAGGGSGARAPRIPQRRRAGRVLARARSTVPRPLWTRRSRRLARFSGDGAEHVRDAVRRVSAGSRQDQVCAHQQAQPRRAPAAARRAARQGSAEHQSVDPCLAPRRKGGLRTARPKGSNGAALDQDMDTGRGSDAAPRNVRLFTAPLQTADAERRRRRASKTKHRRRIV